MTKTATWTKRGVVLLAVGFGACGPQATNVEDDDKKPTTEEITCDEGAAAVTTAQVQQQVMESLCETCHSVDGEAPVDFSTATRTQENAVGQASAYGNGLFVVAANDLAHSTLWLKTLGRNGPNGEALGDQMPPEGEGTLTAEQQKLIKDWICTGAQP